MTDPIPRLAARQGAQSEQNKQRNTMKAMNKPQKISTVLALAAFGAAVAWHYFSNDILIMAGFTNSYSGHEPHIGMALLAIGVFYAGTLAVMTKKD